MSTATAPRPPGTQPVASEAPATPGTERAARRAESRRGVLLGLPPLVYLVVFFAVPLLIVLVYSFATRSATGATVLGGWNLDAYAGLLDSLLLGIAWRSLWLGAVTTLVCLALGYPFAYYIATRASRAKAVLLVLVMIPFWSNFLVRTYAWRVLLGSEGPISQLTQLLGMGSTRIMFTTPAVLIGLVYGYLPFMILPLYAAIERLDRSLVEAARDLYASGWQAFRRVTWPLSRPGVVAGSILVFIPAFGAYVTPEILGGSRTTMLGSYVVDQFLSARHWPYGSAMSIAILAVMVVATTLYFRSGGRTL